MLTEGTKAPDFTLHADDGTMVSLESLRGKKVVLYFYPKDDTPGCTTQACEFRDAWSDVEATGVAVFGVSPDDAKSHARFRKKFGLPFRLLVDEDHKLADALGVWVEKSFLGKKYFGVLRTTFIIDGNGVISRVFEKVKPEGHAAEVLAALA